MPMPNHSTNEGNEPAVRWELVTLVLVQLAIYGLIAWLSPLFDFYAAGSVVGTA